MGKSCCFQAQWLPSCSWAFLLLLRMQTSSLYFSMCINYVVLYRLGLVCPWFWICPTLCQVLFLVRFMHASSTCCSSALSWVSSRCGACSPMGVTAISQSCRRPLYNLACLMTPLLIKMIFQKQANNRPVSHGSLDTRYCADN